MQTLAAGGLGEGVETQILQPVFQLFHRRDHIVERHIGRGVEVEHEASRHIGMARRVVAGMQLQPARLRRRDQGFDPVDLQIGFAVAGHLHQREQRRLSCAGMALKEALVAVDPVRRAHDGAGPPLDLRQHPVTDRLVILRQFQLAHRGVIARIGPQRLVRVGDGNVHHHRTAG